MGGIESAAFRQPPGEVRPGNGRTAARPTAAPGAVRRWLALTVVALAVAGCTSDAGESADARTLTVKVEGTTEVAVTDQWTVEVAAAAAPAGTEILIDPASQDIEDLWDTEGVEMLAAANISLASGQPTV